MFLILDNFFYSIKTKKYVDIIILFYDFLNICCIRSSLMAGLSFKRWCSYYCSIIIVIYLNFDRIDGLDNEISTSLILFNIS